MKDLVNKPSWRRQEDVFIESQTTSKFKFKKKFEDESHIRYSRRVFVNMSLPTEMLNQKGLPKYIFTRNKIRTARYTPLTFVPKNLWLQFKNIANIYFLFLNILTCFPVLGAFSLGISALPLIFILVITATKDAIEDTRRSMLDSQLNNQKCTYLANWYNPNSIELKIGIWRRFKKFCSKMMRKLYFKLFKKGIDKSHLGYSSDEDEEQREPVSRNTKLSLQKIGFKIVNDLAKSSRPRASNEFKEAFKRSRNSIEIPAYIRRRNLDSRETIAEVDETYKTIENEDLNGNKKRSVIDKSRTISHQGYFERTHWKRLKVGDIIKISCDEEIPADVAILSTSEEDGICFVETKNLDGETNLKVRHALRSTMLIKNEDDCEAAVFEIECDAPNADLWRFAGIARCFGSYPKISGGIEEAENENMDLNNILLRGSKLRNTKSVIALVLYTGKDTKVMMNAGRTPSKVSRISRDLNWTILTNFSILFLMCFLTALLAGIFSTNPNDLYKVFSDGIYKNSSILYGIVTFFSGMIIYQNIVPISLYITIEIIRTIQAFFIYSDVHIYYDKFDYPCTPKSWNISDDLGQVEYIFSDKTGTLTQNLMEFRKCTINGVAYGEAYTKAQAGADERRGIDIEEKSKFREAEIDNDRKYMIELVKKSYAAKYLNSDNWPFVSSKLFQDLEYGNSGDEQQNACFKFIFALSICHTVNSNVTEDGTLSYRAQSPDEASLVETARNLGFVLLHRSQSEYTIYFHGKTHIFEILDTIDFSSDRKRMSLITRIDGQIILFCKGADNIIYQRLAPGETDLKRKTEKHLEQFSSEGLRTLVIANKIISLEEYKSWKKKLKEVSKEIVDSDRKMLEVCAEIETDLHILGGTAIEDRLQDGVPDAIAKLLEAGIKIWVLTGDKVETAINIGYACNLLRTNLTNILLTDEYNSVGEAEKILIDVLEKYFGLIGTEKELADAKKDHSPPRSGYALIIDGVCLKLMLNDRIKYKFLLLCKQCVSVLCCRVIPSQKADVTRLVKDGFGVLTLAIGDGANDVAMIQTADVGVGITGEEGRQAVMSADYAVGQFRFLVRLLLVHGRWNYKRLGVTLGVFFYKNIIWTFTLFWFQIFAKFDATMMYQFTYVMLYNLAFTSLSTICLGIFDQDVNDHASLRFPRLYVRGILRKEWSPAKFWLYMLEGLFQSVICFFMPWFLIRKPGPISKNGRDINAMDDFSIMVAIPAVIVINFFTLLCQARWDIISLAVDFISIGMIFFWTGTYGVNSAISDAFFGTEKKTLGSLSNWLVLFSVVIVCLLPRICFMFFQRLYFPTDVHIIQEMIAKGELSEIESSKYEMKSGYKEFLENKPGIKGKVENSNISDGEKPGQMINQDIPLENLNASELISSPKKKDLNLPIFHLFSTFRNMKKM